MNKEIRPIKHISSALTPPGDKSISHRAVLCTALATGESRVRGLSLGADVLSSLHCMESLGVKFVRQDNELIVYSKGLGGFEQPIAPLDCGNSGTTMRLLAGILATSQVSSVLVGDYSLSRRPMMRVVEPLAAMGAQIIATSSGTAPLKITGRQLRGVSWAPAVASAQVKSAILLAGVAAEGVTHVQERHATRDHTERMLRALGFKVLSQEGTISITGGTVPAAVDINVPGDISSAAFFLVLAALLPGSTMRIENVGLNDGRIGCLEVLKQMGADVQINVEVDDFEPMGTIELKARDLRGFEISGALVPRLIDEIPILAVAACIAHGRSIVRDAAELRAKESDRISLLLKELSKMGARCTELPDGFVIEGGAFSGAVVDSHNDHRLAMALSIAGCVASGATVVQNAECVDISYPEFWRDLEKIRGELNA